MVRAGRGGRRDGWTTPQWVGEEGRAALAQQAQGGMPKSVAMRFLTATLGAVLILAAAGSLSAQAVRGELTEEGSGAPIQGAFIALLAEDGRQVGAVLTDEHGRFFVRAPVPGRYRLRAERIGHASTVSPLLEIPAGGVVQHRMAAPFAPVELEGLRVEAGKRCSVRPDVGEETARVWEELRKALAVAAWTEERGIVRYTVARYERELDPQTLRMRKERVDYRSGFQRGSPFVSRPAAELAERGYVQRAEDGDFLYYAPDAEVFLSDVFLDSHCFRLRGASRGQDALIGLAFEPVPGRRLTDIEGVLWLERRTAEVRSLEFRYTRLPYQVESDQVGGRVEFQRLANGAWIVRRWHIRMPIVELRRVRLRDDEPLRQTAVLLGIEEEAGQVLEARVAAGKESDAAGATLAGVILDGATGQPLAGATVYLSGTEYWTRTGPDGRFALEDLPEGEYTVAFTHPLLDSLGFYPPGRSVRVRAGETTSVELATGRSP